MATKKETAADKYPRQLDYTGSKLYSVRHPSHGETKVRARNYAGAIVTAAAVWGERWQRYAFYAFCEVVEHKATTKSSGAKKRADNGQRRGNPAGK